MNILIPNSWLKDYLETNATPQQFAEAMSLTSVSIERINEVDGDFVYDIEVTTNRPDLMSVEGIAREASAVLPQAGYSATFKPYTPKVGLPVVAQSELIKIQNDPELVRRITAVILDVELKPSPEEISTRLEHTGIRSINNVIDVTNYIMRELGHPVHAFDYDRITTKTLIIRRSKPGEKIVTLDGREYSLNGDDIVADDGSGKIVDLLGIMGLENSAITDTSKRVLLFIDNNNPQLLRKTSMNLGIRTEAAILNEKGVDPEKMIPTLLRGVELLQETADAYVVSDLIDIYPVKESVKTVALPFSKINSVIGIDIDKNIIVEILKKLGFATSVNEGNLSVVVPTDRTNDIEIPEDIIEEVARVYGYNKIPNKLPSSTSQSYYHQDKNEYFWIRKIKDAFKYWGFNEVYTYSMVNEALFDGPIEKAFSLRNPLDEDHVYMRNTLTPSVVAVANDNKSYEKLRLFEISNVYIKQDDNLPDERLHLCVYFKGEASFYEGKGIVENVMTILGISEFTFEKKDDGIEGAWVKLQNEVIGSVEFDGSEVIVELDIASLLKLANAGKTYTLSGKFPPIIEDVRIEIDPKVTYGEIVNHIKSHNSLIDRVELLDLYEAKKTFRIFYLDRTKNLTNEDVTPNRESLNSSLEKTFRAKIG